MGMAGNLKLFIAAFLGLCILGLCLFQVLRPTDDRPTVKAAGRGVACDFCRVSLVTSVPVSLVTSQSLPVQIAAVSLLADLWLPWRPFLALLSLLLPLPPPPLHGAQDAHEDLPMMPMRLIVLVLSMLLL
eukprot:s403_g16.t1